MLGDYLNQKALHETCTGADDRGQPTYAAAVSIACRRVKKSQNVLTSTGQLITVQHVYYVKTPVAEGDTLDGKVVMAVPEWTGLGGEILGYKAMMQ